MAKKDKKRRHVKPLRLFVVVLGFLVVLTGFAGAYLFTHPLRLRKTEMTAELNREFHPLDNIAFVLFGKAEDVKVETDTDVNQVGIYTCAYTYKGKKLKAKVMVKDLQYPELEVHDYSTDTVEEVTPEMFVVSVQDQTQVQVTFQKEPSKKEGTQIVEIAARDESGNCTLKEARLTRIKDTAPPLIEVENALTYSLGQEIDFPSLATVSDEADPFPVLQVDAQNVNSSLPGTYTVVYTAVDRSGNSTSINVTVTYVEPDLPDARVVYLTFDDGPSENTTKVLDILARYHAKATFFVTGNHQEKDDYIVRAFQEGHSIGLHSYTHNYAQIYSSVDAYFQDLNQVGDLVEGLIGQRTNLIRFPGGSSNTVSAQYTSGIMSELTQMVRNRGYQYFDWNCSSSDASGNNVPVQQIVDSSTSCRSQYIVLLCHDTDAKDTTVEALPSVIEYYRSQGYIFKALDGNSYAAHHGVNN